MIKKQVIHTLFVVEMPRPNEEIEQILNEIKKGWHKMRKSKEEITSK